MFVGAMVVMATAIVVQSTNTLFSFRLYAQLVIILLVSIGAISFVIMLNILLSAGIERSREFDMRLVVGARRRDVRNQLLFEALFLSVIGGVSGSVCGLLTGFVLTSLLGLPYILHPVSLVLLVSASVVSGTLGGVYPAVRVSHRDLERMLLH
jgi:ABC-type antimicrobial peptide transport system permease subunit